MATIDSFLAPSRPPRTPLVRQRTTAIALVSVAIAAAAISLARSSLWAPSANDVSAARISLTQRVAAAGPLSGFTRPAQPTLIRSAAAWADHVAYGNKAEAIRLSRLGFQAGSYQRLYAQRRFESTVSSQAEQYRSAAGAQRELRYQDVHALRSARASGGRLTPLHVPGIPGARAWIVQDGPSTMASVMFAQGRFYYLLNDVSPGGVGAGSLPPRMFAAAQSLYLTINGCVAH